MLYFIQNCSCYYIEQFQKFLTSSTGTDFHPSGNSSFSQTSGTTHTVESLNNSALQTPYQKFSETPDPFSTLCGNI